MTKNYSRKDFIEFWKKKNEADEKRRLEDIRLPFAKKLEIMDELMEEAIFFDKLRQGNKKIQA